MKRKEGFLLRKIAGDSVLVPTGETSQRFNGLINLTETAAYIWENLERAENEEELVQMIRKEYDVDEETALTDVHGFVSALKEWDMVE